MPSTIVRSVVENTSSTGPSTTYPMRRFLPRPTNQ